MESDFQNSVDEFFMRLALLEATRGLGWTSPNPLVGCVIVKNGRVTARGAHLKDGKTHAERSAIEGAVAAVRGDELKGATLYVNLEPCSHFGRTPPCTDAIIEAAIGRVVWGENDSDTRSAARAREILESVRIEVKERVLRAECESLNERFHHRHICQTPFVALKIAQSLDGRIALENGESKWITCAESRAYVQLLRQTYDAVLVGAGTVRKDNPRLTVRHTEYRNALANRYSSLKVELASELDGIVKRYGSTPDFASLIDPSQLNLSGWIAEIESFCEDRARSPIAVLLDSNGFLTPQHNAIALRNPDTNGDTAPCRNSESSVFIATKPETTDRLARRFEDFPFVKILAVEHDSRGFVVWNSLLEKLSEVGIWSVLVEGGSAVWTDLLQRGLEANKTGGHIEMDGTAVANKELDCLLAHTPDKIYMFVAPKILGGDAIPAIGTLGLNRVNEASEFTIRRIEHTGTDLLLICTIKNI